MRAWIKKGFDAISKKVAGIIVEALESTDVRHRYGVVGGPMN
jgi:hypothetical protein